MRNNFTKLLTLALLAVLITACGGEQKEEIFDAEYGVIDLEYNFNGAEFKIIGMERYGRVEFDPNAETENNYWSEKLGLHYKKIEDEFNINIVVEKDEGDMMTSVVSGLHWADVFDGWLSTINGYVRTGLLMPLNDIEGFEEGIEREKWGSMNSLEAFKRGEDYYGFRANFWGIPFPAFAGVMYSNTTLLHKYNFNAIEMIENGEWTWKNFENICTTIGGNFRNPDDEVGYAFDDSYMYYFMEAAIFSNGGEIAAKDDDGRYVYAMGEPNAIEALEWCVSFYNNLESGLVPNGDFTGEGTDAMYPRFLDNKLAFFCQYSYAGTSDMNGLMYNDVDFNIVPFPCGPKGTYGEWGSYISFADRYNVVPKTANLDIVNAVFDPLFEAFDGETETSWKGFYEGAMFMTTDSAKNYFEMYDSAKSDFYDVSRLFPWANVLSGKRAVSAGVQEIANQAMDILNSYYNLKIED